MNNTHIYIYTYTYHYIFTLMTHFQATPKQSSEDPEMICSQARQYEQHLPEWTQEFAEKLRSVEFGSPDDFLMHQGQRCLLGFDMNHVGTSFNSLNFQLIFMAFLSNCFLLQHSKFDLYCLCQVAVLLGFPPPPPPTQNERG